jgi:hypothetical protein
MPVLSRLTTFHIPGKVAGVHKVIDCSVIMLAAAVSMVTFSLIIKIC